MEWGVLLRLNFNQMVKVCPPVSDTARELPVTLLTFFVLLQCCPGPGVGPGGACGPGSFLWPHPRRGLAPVKYSGPAPDGAFAPDELPGPAPGGAFAPAKYSGPAPGGVKAPAAPDNAHNLFQIEKSVICPF